MSKDSYEAIEELRVEGLTAVAGVLELVSDGAKAVAMASKRKAREIRKTLLSKD